MLRIDGPPDSPERTLLALDPHDDRLFGTSVVDAVHDSLSEAALG
jgi:hypothetical protein